MTEEATSTTTIEGNEQAPETTSEKVETPEAKPESEMIPKARLDKEIAKRKALEEAAAELDALKKAQADDAAKKAGDLEKFQKERDEAATERDALKALVEADLNSMTESMDAEAKASFDRLADGLSLAKQLDLARALGAKESTSPAVGTKGGQGNRETGGPIPADVQTKADFHGWLAELQQTPKGKQQLADPEFNKALTQERIRRGLT